jgi:hypothetical protein
MVCILKNKTDLVAAEAMAEKRPADSGPEEAITDIEGGPKAAPLWRAQ